ncbi:penicillin-binding transpeptidase domain-containing protein, partial [Lacticaseibacillus paracasei]
SFERPLDQAITSFGQGIEVNVMQMLQAISAVSNGGKMLKPQIVSKVISQNGKTKVYKPEVVGQPISKETAAQVIDAMRHVVNDEDGTGVAYKMPGVDLAVLTG